MKRGAGVNARNNDGLTALHIAAETDNLSLCKDLVNRGADVTAIYNSSKVKWIFFFSEVFLKFCHVFGKGEFFALFQPVFRGV